MTALIEGFKIGHASDFDAVTGLTVVICEEGATPGIDLRGAAPGTRETELMRPENLVDRVHAIVLSGGSALGLGAADGAVRWLREREVGWPTTGGKVPIVASAIIYDLAIGLNDRPPNTEMAYQACSNASSAWPQTGTVGVGTGATVGKVVGADRCLKSGLGFAADRLESGITVQALVAVNASGSVVDPANGATIGGPRGDEPGQFLDSRDLLRRGEQLKAYRQVIGESTTLGVVMTDVALRKQDATRVAMMAQAGQARTIVPAWAMSDGDIVFVLAHGEQELQIGELTALGAIAAAAIEKAILGAVRAAESLGGVPAARDWLPA
jgi:L-aminopeptidase/D-esterase-like protein